MSVNRIHQPYLGYDILRFNQLSAHPPPLFVVLVATDMMVSCFRPPFVHDTSLSSPLSLSVCMCEYYGSVVVLCARASLRQPEKNFLASHCVASCACLPFVRCHQHQHDFVTTTTTTNPSGSLPFTEVGKNDHGASNRSIQGPVQSTESVQVSMYDRVSHV